MFFWNLIQFNPLVMHSNSIVHSNSIEYCISRCSGGIHTEYYVNAPAGRGAAVLQSNNDFKVRMKLKVWMLRRSSCEFLELWSRMNQQQASADNTTDLLLRISLTFQYGAWINHVLNKTAVHLQTESYHQGVQDAETTQSTRTDRMPHNQTWTSMMGSW